MKTQLTKVIATGQWHSKWDCPDSPRYGKHRFRDISTKLGAEPGEMLISSRCEYCGGLIVDCPTIGLAEFAL
jgi:hypothetical protein